MALQSFQATQKLALTYLRMAVILIGNCGNPNKPSCFCSKLEYPENGVLANILKWPPLFSGGLSGWQSGNMPLQTAAWGQDKGRFGGD